MTTIFFIILVFLIIVYLCLILYDAYFSEKLKNQEEESYPPIKYVFSPPQEVTDKMLLPDITDKKNNTEEKDIEKEENPQEVEEENTSSAPQDIEKEPEEEIKIEEEIQEGKKPFPQFNISCIPSDRLKAPSGLEILKESPTYIKLLTH